MRSREEYLELPRRITNAHYCDHEGKEGFVPELEKLPGAMGQGETPEEVVSRVYDAVAGWINVTLESGRDVPERDAA